ncbi:MAG: nicotinate (nicotinamide) nucleotide adenylyltransferase [Chitinivibrionales bacterium]|nr:nicotinate (nicotinamide) nucleotide adenylyltransferase [Chitinivibrionales bacterium]MBD3357749.1 nicotinate (nicotinamide) nucleotide adenylyltransferase [Chitinivibrionales bacterium]
MRYTGLPRAGRGECVNNQPSRIGILGGSFDPVHYGHLAVARLAYEYLMLDRILLIPAAVPPHKRAMVGASAERRLTMLCSATDEDPAFLVSDMEIRRSGISYTVDTLQALREEFPHTEFCYLIGSDNLREIASWRHFRSILDMVTLCVAHRPGYSMSPPADIAGARMCGIPSPEWGVSSTMIRQRLAQGYSCRYLVPESVREYIACNNLYGAGGMEGGYDGERQR